jgi:hypothetical protein
MRRIACSSPRASASATPPLAGRGSGGGDDAFASGAGPCENGPRASAAGAAPGAAASTVLPGTSALHRSAAPPAGDRGIRAAGTREAVLAPIAPPWVSRGGGGADRIGGGCAASTGGEAPGRPGRRSEKTGGVAPSCRVAAGTSPAERAAGSPCDGRAAGVTLPAARGGSGGRSGAVRCRSPLSVRAAGSPPGSAPNGEASSSGSSGVRRSSHRSTSSSSSSVGGRPRSRRSTRRAARTAARKAGGRSGVLTSRSGARASAGAAAPGPASIR